MKKVIAGVCLLVGSFGAEAGGLDFALPVAITPTRSWVAEDLSAIVAHNSAVTSWADRLAAAAWSTTDSNGSGAPTLLRATTPTGLAAIQL